MSIKFSTQGNTLWRRPRSMILRNNTCIEVKNGQQERTRKRAGCTFQILGRKQDRTNMVIFDK